MVHPIQYMNLQSRSAYMMLAGVWLLTTLLCLPPLLIPDESIDFDYCRTNHYGTSLLVYTALTAFFVPLAVIVLCYVKIFVELYRKMARKEKRKRQEFELISGNGASNATARKTSSKENGVANVTKDVNSNQRPPASQVRQRTHLILGVWC